MGFNQSSKRVVYSTAGVDLSRIGTSSRSEGSNMIPVLIAIVVAFFVAGLIWLLVEWTSEKDPA